MYFAYGAWNGWIGPHPKQVRQEAERLRKFLPLFRDLEVPGIMGIGVDSDGLSEFTPEGIGPWKIKEFTSAVLKAKDLRDGRVTFTEKWRPKKLWDIHTPQNTYDFGLSLLNADGKVLDAFGAVRFGFREFWIDGRDFFLNGSRVFLSAVPLDNAQVGAYAATYDGTRKINRPHVEDVSDKSWPTIIQKSWPYFIMGVSQTWLGMISQKADELGEDVSGATLYAYEKLYRRVAESVDEMWRHDGRHAFFHHLNALFGYKPLVIYERKLMTF